MKSACLLLLLSGMTNAQSVETVTARYSASPGKSQNAVTARRSEKLDGSHLPCLSSSAECVERLTAQAVNASQEVRLIDESIKLASRRRWTNYIAADSFNPIGSVLKLTRNIAGGGDVQQARLVIAALELRRAETVEALRVRVRQFVTAHEQATTKQARLGAQLDTHKARVSLLEVNYRSGEGDTGAMLGEWQRTDELRAQIDDARREADDAQRNLMALIQRRETGATLDTKRNKAK